MYIFPLGTTILTNTVTLGVSKCFIDRETCNFFLKFREIFPCRETVLRVHGMKFDEKTYFCQIYVILLETMVHVMIDRYFSLFLKGLKIFLNPRQSLIVPLRLKKNLETGQRDLDTMY